MEHPADHLGTRVTVNGGDRPVTVLTQNLGMTPNFAENYIEDMPDGDAFWDYVKCLNVLSMYRREKKDYRDDPFETWAKNEQWKALTLQIFQRVFEGQYTPDEHDEVVEAIVSKIGAYKLYELTNSKDPQAGAILNATRAFAGFDKNVPRYKNRASYDPTPGSFVMDEIFDHNWKDQYVKRGFLPNVIYQISDSCNDVAGFQDWIPFYTGLASQASVKLRILRNLVGSLTKQGITKIILENKLTYEDNKTPLGRGPLPKPDWTQALQDQPLANILFKQNWDDGVTGRVFVIDNGGGSITMKRNGVELFKSKTHCSGNATKHCASNGTFQRFDKKGAQSWAEFYAGLYKTAWDAVDK